MNGHFYGGAANQNFQWNSGPVVNTPPTALIDTATVTATSGPQTTTASTSAQVDVVSPGVLDASAPATGTNLETYYGNASELEWLFSSSTAVQTKYQGTGSGSATQSSSNLGSASSQPFVVFDNSASDSTSGATVYFGGTVHSGSDVFVDAPVAGTFSTLYAHLFSSEAAFESGAAAIQETAYNAGSSTPGMALNDTVGSFKLVGYLSSANHGYLV